MNIECMIIQAKRSKRVHYYFIGLLFVKWESPHIVIIVDTRPFISSSLRGVVINKEVVSHIY
jgi:hypothetical protein